MGLQNKSNDHAPISIPSPEVVFRSFNKTRDVHNFQETSPVKIESALLGLSHHILNRRAIRLTRESRYLIQAKLNSWRQKPPNAYDLVKEIDELYKVFSGLTDLLEVSVDGMSRVDGAGQAHREALQRLTDAFNAELDRIQNPKDCSKAKHLVVDFNKGCGFGCQIHHAAHCFRLAIATGRVLHLKSNRLTYSQQGFVSVFKPLTNCSLPDGDMNIHWGHGGFENAQTVFCPNVEQFLSVPEYAHPAVPASIADALNHLHGAPSIWISGHLTAYLMRFQAGEISDSIDKTLQSLRDPSNPQPVVGVHVRRTDKIGTEANFHKFEEYMTYVDKYYDKLDTERIIRERKEEWIGDNTHIPTQSFKRRVFIATDDPNVFKEARDAYGDKLGPDGYPLYEFIGDEQRAQSAALQTRYSHGSLIAVVTDVTALSNTDYLVCTFSSQIGRLAYELMQTKPMLFGDASMRAQSLDDSYYYGGQQQWFPTAIIDDKETEIKAGDRIGVLGNHWNGYARIHINKTGKEEIRPAYKFESSFKRVDFPGFKMNATSVV